MARIKACYRAFFQQIDEGPLTLLLFPRRNILVNVPIVQKNCVSSPSPPSPSQGADKVFEYIYEEDKVVDLAKKVSKLFTDC